MRYKDLIGRMITLVIILMLSNTSFAQLNPLNIGTIDPGDSIMVYYDVTINTACGCSQINNQGTVSGSNFATLNTDDPDTPAPGDVTVTPLNLFIVAANELDLSAQYRNSGIALTWSVTAETNLLKYEVERSTDGRSFAKIGEAASVNSPSGHNYSFFDAAPNSGLNFYRIKIISNSAVAKYSAIIRMDQENKNGGMEVYPNPVVQKQFNLQLNNIEKGDYRLTIYNIAGQAIYSSTIHHNAGTGSNSIILPATLSAGIYNLRLQGTQQVYSRSVLVH